MSGLGPKIIESLKQAVAGDLARVTIEGEAWAKVKDIHADQQEIMRINNEMRVLLLEIREAMENDYGWGSTIKAIDAVVK